MISYLEIADKPVVEGLEQHEVVIAKDQPEYRPLRSLRATTVDGRLLTRWSFTEAERKAIAEGADLFIQIMTFHGKLQPLLPFIADKLEADFVRRDYELGEEPPAPLKDPSSQLISVNFAEIERRVMEALIAGNHLAIIDKLINKVSLTPEERQIVDGLTLGQ